MNKAPRLLPALPLVFFLSSCSDYEDPQTLANDTPQFEEMMCHKPHDIPVSESPKRYHHMSERPLILEAGQNVIKPEFKKAQELWARSEGARYTHFDPKHYKPDSSYKPGEVELDKGYLVIGCAEPDGAAEDANFNLSHARASTIANRIAEKIVEKRMGSLKQEMIAEFSERMSQESAINAVNEIFKNDSTVRDMEDGILQQVLSKQMCTVPLGTYCSSMGVNSGSTMSTAIDRTANSRFVKVSTFDLE